MAKRRARGEGSLRKRSDGRWEGRYTVGRDEATGKLLYRNVLAKTQAECKAKLREAIRNTAQEAPVSKHIKSAPKEVAAPVQRFTVAEWLRTWFELYSKPNLRETTQEQYTNFLEKHLIPNIGDIPLEKLTSLRLQKLYQDLRTSGRVVQNQKAGPGLSAKTVRNIHMLLHSALDQAVKEDLIKKNPTDGCSAPKPEKKEMKVIQPEQIGNYLQAAAERNVLPMFYLELTSGLRRGELLALLWTDLDIAVFCRLAEKLGITRRFVGSEPFCPVTSAYNRAMARKLPEKGIELVELPRLEQGGTAISATAVRKLIRAGRWEDIRPLVPEATFAYFSAPENRQRFLKRDV